MNKILVPLFSLIISFNAHGEWTFVAEGLPINNTSHTHYVDFDSVKVNGNVYHWKLSDYSKPDQWGDLSFKYLYETDCNIPQKARVLSQSYYTQPMGEGSTSTTSINFGGCACSGVWTFANGLQSIQDHGSWKHSILA